MTDAAVLRLDRLACVLNKLFLLVIYVDKAIVLFLITLVLVLRDSYVLNLTLVDLDQLLVQVLVRRCHDQALIVLVILELVVVMVLVYCR